MTATENPFDSAGATSPTPRASAYSLTNFSIAPMHTGSDGPFSMQLPSQSRSCGHTREQISGMLLVERQISAAPRNAPSAGSASHSGIRFSSGQPARQLGLGHWMQRLALAAEGDFLG